MPAITESTHEIETFRCQSHPRCVVCGRSCEFGFGLEFRRTDHGFVEASFDCGSAFQGYPNILHGGIICSLLDGAMTNCLFAHELTAVTAELTVRFRHPIVTGRRATVRARVESSMRPLHMLTAEVLQNGRVMATAKGKFVEKPDVAWPEGR